MYFLDACESVGSSLCFGRGCANLEPPGTNKKFEVFEESVQDLNILVATTNRMRSVKKKQINFQKLNKIILNSKNKVGIIFGPEKSGLENEHLSICDYSLKINSNPRFSSLNLSHAVSIVAYEIWSRNFIKKSLSSGSRKKK